MELIREMDQLYVKQASGVFVPFHEITGWATGATGGLLTKDAGDTLAMRDLVGAGGISITVTADEIEIDGSGVSGGGGGGGAMALLDSQTASNSASLDMVTGFSSTYDEYELRFAIIPASDNVSLLLRMSSNAGSSWDSGASDYRYKHARQRSGTSGFDSSNQSNGATSILLANNIGSDTGEGVAGRVYAPTLRDATLRKMIHWTAVDMSDVAEVCEHSGAGSRTSSSQFNGLQLFFSSGNVESGWARLYGIAKS